MTSLTFLESLLSTSFPGSLSFSRLSLLSLVPRHSRPHSPFLFSYPAGALAPDSKGPSILVPRPQPAKRARRAMATGMVSTTRKAEERDPGKEFALLYL